jgi:hypothetical protein
MMNRTTFTIRTLVLVSLLFVSSFAMAQLSGPTSGAPRQAPAQGQQQNRGANRSAPPLPPATDSIGITAFMYYAIILVLGGAAIAVSVMPGKRGHQD